MVRSGGLRVQSGGGESAPESGGVHGRELRLCLYAPGYAAEAREHLSGDAVVVSAGFTYGPVRQFRVRSKQEGGGGSVPFLWRRDRREGACVPVPESLRQMVQA